jgi:hypothetical protein
MESYYGPTWVEIDWIYVSEGDVIRVKSMPSNAQSYEVSECDQLDYTGLITLKNERPDSSRMELINGEIIPVIPSHCSSSNIIYYRQTIPDFRRTLNRECGIRLPVLPRHWSTDMNEHERRQKELQELEEFEEHLRRTLNFGNLNSEIRYLRSLHNN